MSTSRLLVLMRLVPDLSVPIRFDYGGRRAVTTDTSGITNPADLTALQAAIAIATDTGSELVVASVGPPEAETMLRHALSLGANRAVLIKEDPRQPSDALSTALVLARLCSILEPTLVLCGTRCPDWGSGQVGPAVAELTGIPHLAHVTRASLQNRGHLCVQRNIGGGVFEEMRCRLPALLTFDADFKAPPYASLPALIDALTTDIQLSSELGLAADAPSFLPQKASVQVVSMSNPRPRPKRGESPSPSLALRDRLQAVLGGGVTARPSSVLEGTARDLAERLVCLLRDEGFLPGADESVK